MPSTKMEYVKYGEELEANDANVNEKDSSGECTYCKIKAVYADSPILEHLNHTKGCKCGIKDNIRPALKNRNQDKKCNIVFDKVTAGEGIVEVDCRCAMTD